MHVVIPKVGGVEIRPVTFPDDRRLLAQLFEEVRWREGHEPLSEQKEFELRRLSPGWDGYVIEVADGDPGYIHVSHNPAFQRCGVELVLSEALHKPNRVLEVAQRAVELAGGEHLTLWAATSDVVAVLMDAGWRVERTLLQLRRRLPPEQRPLLPNGLVVRPLRPGIDEDAFLAVNNAAFAGHPENGSWSRAMLRERMSLPWFDPTGFLLAWDGTKLAGFNWTKVHDEDVGEIYVIAVAPSHRGRGLGTALTLEGLWYLFDERGVTTAMLYVDGDNYSARRVYEGLGFKVERTTYALEP